MEKYHKTKRILANRAKKLMRRRIRSRLKLKAKRKRQLGISKEQQKRIYKKKKEQYLFQRKFIAYKHIEAPKCLSMIEKTEDTLAFIKRLEDSLSKKEKVFVVLKNVEVISGGAIVVLLSIMIKFRDKGVAFNGDYPKSLSAKKKIQNSGFFERLYKQKGDSYSIEGRSGILTHADKIVDQKLSDGLIAKASELIWGKPHRCTGVQKVYIELMQNTNNHASLDKPKEHHWYTTVSYNKDENKVCFSFIDYGVGIIQSINKNEKGKFWGFLSKFKEMWNPKNNGEFLKLLLNGSLHKTATGHYYRGKGLPGVYKAFQDKKISNLVVITNDAFADCNEEEYKTLKNKIEGTYIYWELTQDNIKLPA